LYDITCRQIWSQKFVDDYKDLGGSVLNALETVPGREALEERLFLGFSIGTPGMYNPETGEMLSTVLPVSGYFDLEERLKRRTNGQPVMIRNVSSFFAYAEQQFGIGKGVSNLISIDVGVGIGSGIIIDGQIFTGSQGLAGEIGHVTIDINGPKCKCGSNGCLEVMSNTTAILRNVTEAVRNDSQTVLIAVLKEAGAIDLPALRRGLEADDPLVSAVLDRHARMLACAVNSVYNLLNPEMVVISGEITLLGPIFLEMIRQHLEKMRITFGPDSFRLVFSEMNKVSALLGGAKYLIDSVLSGGDLYYTVSKLG